MVFDGGSPDSDEEGGTIYSIQASRHHSSRPVGSCVEITFGPGQLNMKRIKVISLSSCCTLLLCRWHVRAPQQRDKEVALIGGYSTGGTITASQTVSCLEKAADMECSWLQAGDLVWRNKDPALEAQARASYESLSSSETRKVPVTAVVSGSIGQVGETASGLVSEMRLHMHQSKYRIIQSCSHTKPALGAL